MWKIPFRSFPYLDGNEDTVLVHYISPIDFIKYLLEKAPELVFGGHTSPQQGGKQLASFWGNYEKWHGTHRLFLENHPERSLENTLCISFHGDEGRGLKKGNTAILMFESNLGVETADNITKKRRLDKDCGCVPKHNYAKRFKLSSGLGYSAQPVLASYESYNTKCNSFLTKFCLAALPNSLCKETDALNVVIDKICQDFRSLFEEGVEINGTQFFAAVTGLKGDLKWYEKIAGLKRCFNRQIGSGLAMCHECGAGTQALPFEDHGHSPIWGNSLYPERPWEQSPSIAMIPFEPEGGKPEMILRRDIFHNSKVGILRDYVGSSILLLVKLGYWNSDDPNESNRRETCLERAHSSFLFWQKTVGKRAALRSFTPTFLNAKTQSDFGWISSKGSDTTLLVKWLLVATRGFLNDPMDPSHTQVLNHMNQAAACVLGWQNVLYSHGNWLARHCGILVYQHIHDFLVHYNALAFFSLYSFQFTGYGMKSKYHMMAHTKHELGLLLQNPSVQWLPNPILFGCEMNEDVIGKIARLSRKVSSTLTTKRTLELYLTKCKAIHNRFRRQKWEKKKCPTHQASNPTSQPSHAAATMWSWFFSNLWSLAMFYHINPTDASSFLEFQQHHVVVVDGCWICIAIACLQTSSNYYH